MIGEDFMRISNNGKKQYSRSRHSKGASSNTWKAAGSRAIKQPRKAGYRIVSSPDSEIMATYIEKFDYMPENRAEILKKYERMVLPTCEYKR